MIRFLLYESWKQKDLKRNCLVTHRLSEIEVCTISKSLHTRPMNQCCYWLIQSCSPEYVIELSVRTLSKSQHICTGLYSWEFRYSVYYWREDHSHLHVHSFQLIDFHTTALLWYDCPFCTLWTIVLFWLFESSRVRVLGSGNPSEKICQSESREVYYTVFPVSALLFAL